MDWKREAVEKLRSYELKKSSLSRSEMELARLEEELCALRAASTEDVRVSGGESRREDAIVSNIARRGELRLVRRSAQRWVQAVDGALSELDGEERLILQRLYIARVKGNVDRLCEELCVEQATVYRRRDAALRHFTLALYGALES